MPTSTNEVSGPLGRAMDTLRPRTGSLYEHAGDIRALALLLEELDGQADDKEALATLAVWWNEVEGALETKADRMLAYVRELEVRSEARVQEADRLVKLAGRDAKRAERIRSLLHETLEALGRDRLETPRFKIAIVENGGARAVHVVDEDALPPEFFKPAPPRGPIDKKAIARALEAERDVPGATLLPRGKRLRIE